jgi:cytochrome c553
LKSVLNPFTFHWELALVFGLALGQDVFAIEDFVAEEKAYYLCAGCHGPETGSVLYPMPHDIPAIIGQKKDYLLKQLISYREGRRIHPNMSDVLSGYTNQNLADLAEYYEGLGPKRPGRASHIPPLAVAPTHVEATPPAVHSGSHAYKKKAKKAKKAKSATANTDNPNTSH